MIDQYAYLYVEDDAMSREALGIVFTRVLKVSRWQVFEDSENFLARVQSLPYQPDIFLLDIHMKPHTGFEMLKMLRGEPAYSKARIVALTASVMNEEVDLLRQSGFDAVIGKPINLSTFPDLIRAIIDGEQVWQIT